MTLPKQYTFFLQKCLKLILHILHTICIIFILISRCAYASDLESQYYQIYISKSFINEYSTPSISASDSTSSAKWFDDYPSLSVGNKTEVGIINGSSDISFALRHQSVRGSHSGSTSKYTCFGVFCSWVDYSLIGNLESNDSIVYDIQFLQLWGAKTFKISALEISPLVGVNLIDANFDIAGAGNFYNLKETVPLPFIGFNIKYLLSKDIDLIYDMHFSEVDLQKIYLSFIDSEFEIRYNISKFWKIGVGSSRLFVNLKTFNGVLNSELNIPQHASFAKITFLY